MSQDEKKKPAEFRTYNRYNIYFTLERENFVLAKGGVTKWSTMDKAKSASKQSARHGYENLNLPPFPPRFANLNVPDDWCVPGIRHLGEKRSHAKSHGVASFREIARTVAASWKAVDGETLEWCMAVEKVLKVRHAKLKEVERKVECESRTKEASNAYQRRFQAARARQQLIDATRSDPACPAVHQFQVTETMQQLPPTPIFPATHFGATRAGHLAAVSGTSAYNNNGTANSGNRNHRDVSQSEISRAVSVIGASAYNNYDIVNSGNHNHRDVSQSEISRAVSVICASTYKNDIANRGDHNHRDVPLSKISRAVSADKNGIANNGNHNHRDVSQSEISRAVSVIGASAYKNDIAKSENHHHRDVSQSEISRAVSVIGASAYKNDAATVIVKHSAMSPQRPKFASEHINNTRLPLPLGWKAAVDRKSGKIYYYRRPDGEPDPNSPAGGKVPAATKDSDGNDVNRACSFTGSGSSTNNNSSRDTVTHRATPHQTTITHPAYENSSVNATSILLPPGWKAATDKNSGNIFYYRHTV